MLDCLILGDSIAVGTHMFHRECVTYSKGGINSWQWNKMWPAADLSAETVIISLGSNDHRYIRTESELRKIRERVHGKKVFWILPHGNNPKGGVTSEHIDEIVSKIANEYHDHIIPIKYIQKDNIHPSWRGYKEIVRETE